MMGLFDGIKSWRDGRKQKSLDRNLRTLKNPKAIREDRAAAIEFFVEHPDREEAIPALLQRFEYSLEHGIMDAREKEKAMSGITRFGKDALPLVKSQLLQTTRIAWPIKILKAIGSDQDVTEALKAALDFSEVTFDQAKVDKNYDVLCYLRDYKVPDFVERLGHFLKDNDERVRFAAIEVLIEQDSPAIKKMLEPFLADTSSENRRIREDVIQCFLKHGWKVEDRQAFPEGFTIEGRVAIDRDGRLVAR